MSTPVLPLRLPETGPNAQKAKFFVEVATAFEILALLHTLTAEEQRALNEFLRGLTVSAAARHPK